MTQGPDAPDPALLRIRALRRAAELLGGISPLAKRLGVQSLLVARWLDGDEAVPEPVFLAAVGVVLDFRDPPTSR